MKAIVVFYDSLNKRYLPPYHPDCRTIAPNFTRLAEHCACFENSYVGSMPCIPARRELHTGRYNFLHREWGPLEPFDDSMPELLKKSGVYTHLISDHLHYWEDGGSTYHNRYSSWEVVRGQEGDHWKGQVKRPEIPPVVRVPQKQTGTGESSLWKHDWVNRQYIKEEADFPQTRCFDRGCEFIELNHQEDNWLLQLETFDPHEPFYAPQNYLDLYPEDYNGRHFDWPRGKVEEQADEIAHCRRQYQAVVTMCDHNLGRILDLMDRYDLWQDTMLIVGTDHGFLLAEHGYWGKNQMPYYNEVANNPLFIWDPRSQVKGEKRNALVQMIDWAPTLLGYFGQPVPPDMQGGDLAATVRSDEKVRDYALFGVFSGHVNVTDGHHVYMRAPLPDKVNDIYNYTLVPIHMTERFSPEELRTAELTGPFRFTKGCRVLKIKGTDKYHVGRFGTLLFDLDNDPGEQKPLTEPALEEVWKKVLVAEMEKAEAPAEQYARLGLEAPAAGQPEPVIEERNILLRATATDWEQAMRQSGQLLIDSGYITPGYVESTVNTVKEMGPYIVLGPGLALSHARPDGNVLRTGISLLTLKEPVEFGSELGPVSVVLTLAAKDEESHLAKLAVIAEIFSDPENMNRIVRETDVGMVAKLFLS